jgi:hypothetical protein
MQTTAKQDADQLVTVQFTVAELGVIRKGLVAIDFPLWSEQDKASDSAFGKVERALQAAKQ